VGHGVLRALRGRDGPLPLHREQARNSKVHTCIHTYMHTVSYMYNYTHTSTRFVEVKKDSPPDLNRK
jgi:hypothetical protein